MQTAFQDWILMNKNKNGKPKEPQNIPLIEANTNNASQSEGPDAIDTESIVEIQADGSLEAAAVGSQIPFATAQNMSPGLIRKFQEVGLRRTKAEAAAVESDAEHKSSLAKLELARADHQREQTRALKLTNDERELLNPPTWAPFVSNKVLYPFLLLMPAVFSVRAAISFIHEPNPSNAVLSTSCLAVSFLFSKAPGFVADVTRRFRS